MSNSGQSQLSAITAGDDATVRIWDAATREVRHILEGHTHGVNGVAISLDGTRLASAGDDATVRVWDAATGRLETMLRVARELTGCAWGSDGTSLLVSGLAGLYHFTIAGPSVTRA